MKPTFSNRKAFILGFAGLATAFGLVSCLSGEPSCTTLPDPPIQIALNPDSLALVPVSQSVHFFQAEGNFTGYARYLSLAVSRSENRSAFAYFDSNDLSLFVDTLRIPTPSFSLDPGGWGRCPLYSETMSRVAVDTSNPETALTLQVRKGGIAVRSWKVEFHSDTVNIPGFRIVPAPEGLALGIGFKPGAQLGSLQFGAHNNSRDVPFQRAGDSIHAVISFKAMDHLHYQVDTATVNQAYYTVCALTDAGYESVTVDGVPFPANAEYCWQLTGESRAKVKEYVTRFCKDCK
jgi:hypothetical protein